MVSHKLMDALKGLGLNLYERKLFLSILQLKVATAGELASLSNVPRNRTYDVMESLVNKGLALMQPGRPVKFIAVNPSDALERLKEKIMEKAREKIERIDYIKNSELIKELEEIYGSKTRKEVEIEATIGTLKGRGAILSQIVKMLRDSKKSFTIFVTENNIDDILSLSSYLEEARKRGVDIRISTFVSGKINDKIRTLSDIYNLNITKNESSIKTSLFLSDEREALVYLNENVKDPSQKLALWTNNEEVVKNLFSKLL